VTSRRRALLGAIRPARRGSHEVRCGRTTGGTNRLRAVNHPAKVPLGRRDDGMRKLWNEQYAPRAVKLAPKGLLKFTQL
jgi:hypothetical protein